MASSFIDFKGYGFWASDGFVESFQLLLFDAIQSQYLDSVDWLNEYNRRLALESLPLICGGMSMCLDETITDPEKTGVILSLIDTISTRLATDKDYRSGIHLNELRRVVRQYLVQIGEFDWDEKEIEQQLNDGGYVVDLPYERYLRGFELSRRLVAGELRSKADSAISYWD